MKTGYFSIPTLPGRCYEQMTTRNLLDATIDGDKRALWYLFNVKEFTTRRYYDHFFCTLSKLCNYYTAENNIDKYLDSLIEYLTDKDCKALRTFKGEPNKEEGVTYNPTTADKVFEKTFFKWISLTSHRYFIRLLKKDTKDGVKYAPLNEAITVDVDNVYDINHDFCMAMLYDCITRLKDEEWRYIVLSKMSEDKMVRSSKNIADNLNARRRLEANGRPYTMVTEGNVNKKYAEIRARLGKMLHEAMAGCNDW